MKNYYAIAMEKMKNAIPWGPGKIRGWENLFNKKGADGRVGPDKVALKAAQETYRKQSAEFLQKTETEINSLLPKVSPQVLAVIGGKPEQKEGHSDDVHAQNLAMFLEKIRDAVAAGPVSGSAQTSKPAPAAVVPEQKPVPAATAQPSTPKLTAEGLGKTVNALATHPDPAVRTPIVQGLQQSLAAAKPRPDFSFITGMERAQLAAEFDRLGGLSERNHKLFMYRRRQYCEAHRLTPEQVSGSGQAVIPEMIPAAELKAREAQVSARKALPALNARLHQVNLRVLQQAKANGGKVSSSIVQERARILQQVNKLEKTLGLTLTP